MTLVITTCPRFLDPISIRSTFGMPGGEPLVNAFIFKYNRLVAFIRFVIRCSFYGALVLHTM